MSVWTSAQNVIDLSNASLSTFQVFDRVTRLDGPYDGDLLKSSLSLVRAVVVAMMEGYQGKLRGRQINDALSMLMTELDGGGKPSLAMIEKFKAAL